MAGMATVPPTRCRIRGNYSVVLSRRSFHGASRPTDGSPMRPTSTWSMPAWIDASDQVNHGEYQGLCPCDDITSAHEPDASPSSGHVGEVVSQLAQQAQNGGVSRYGTHDVERIVLSARDGNQCFCAQLSPEYCTLKGDIGVQPVRT